MAIGLGGGLAQGLVSGAVNYSNQLQAMNEAAIQRNAQMEAAKEMAMFNKPGLMMPNFQDLNQPPQIISEAGPAGKYEIPGMNGVGSMLPMMNLFNGTMMTAPLPLKPIRTRYRASLRL